jgi:hypothetical protein
MWQTLRVVTGARPFLKSAATVDDTGCMIEHEWQQLRDNPDWAQVLTAYATLADEALAERPPTEKNTSENVRAASQPEGDAADQGLLPAQSTTPSEAGRDTGWICRLTEIEGVSSSRLSTIHGKLIAFGFLNFELTNRTTGMRYQVTSLGRRCLRWLATDTGVSAGHSESDKQAA